MAGMKTKEDAAKTLIDWHFEIEPGQEEAFHVLSDDENAPDEPIKLLEVNVATIPTHSVEAYAFAPAGDIPFRVVVAEVTPAALQRVLASPDRLPRGWDLSRAKRFTRQEAI